jgi:trehalose/maltose hydrolase-like predicted phosphorylase
MMKSMAGALAVARSGYLFAGSSLPVLGYGGTRPQVDPAYVSNGFIGIRPGPIPLLPAPACVTGFVYLHPDFQVEALSPAPYPLTTDLRVNGASLRQTERTTLTTQTLDMNNGELATEFVYDCGGDVRLIVKVQQFASRSEPTLLWQRVELQTSAPTQVDFLPQVSLADVPGQLLRNAPPGTGGVDRALLFQSAGNLSRLGVAIRVLPDEKFSRSQDLSGYTGNIVPSQTYTFHVLASMVSSFYHDEPDMEATRLVNWGVQTGAHSLLADNRRAWSELWRSRVLITGDDQDQKVVDAAFFYLHSSLHPANLNGMAPYGLSSSRYYLGHTFWDTDTWSLLPVLLCSPRTAESLLRFRLRGLAAAKKAAGLFGYRGAQFPWEAAPLSGEEVTPLFASTGWAEQHIVPDVALAFWQYQLATADKDFLDEATWPVLRAVAEWIESRGVTTARGFEIHNIMGPDETSNGLDNSAYVNLACRMVMKAAIRCAQMKGTSSPARWHAIASDMYLPLNARGALAIAEGSPEVAAADISFLLPFDLDLDPAVLESTWRTFRDKKRSTGGIGFGLAAASALAATMGDRKAAAELFRASWERFWLEPFAMIREASSQTYGCFLTNYGAILQAAMLGFTGIRIGESDWNKYNVTLPENWKSIEIERIYVRGEQKHIIAKHGSKARILDGAVNTDGKMLPPP